MVTIRGATQRAARVAHQETRMEFRVLGCSGGLSRGGHTTAFSLGGHTLIDAGTGVGRLSIEEMQGLQRVFITHAHLDHVAGLAFLADTRFAAGAPPLPVHARASVLRTLRKHLFNWQLWPDFMRLGPDQRPTLEPHRIHIGRSIALSEAVVTPLPARHTVPACGYAVETPRATLVYSGDTTACRDFWRALNRLPRLDHLVIEIAYGDEQEALGHAARHYTPAVLGEQLQRLRHRPCIHLMHHKPGRGEHIVAQCKQALAGWDYRHLEGDDRLML